MRSQHSELLQASVFKGGRGCWGAARGTPPRGSEEGPFQQGKVAEEHPRDGLPNFVSYCDSTAAAFCTFGNTEGKLKF